MTIPVTRRKAAPLAIAIIVVGLLTLVLGAAPAMAEFGVQRFAASVSNPNGTPDVQAGSHPYSLTTTFLLNGVSEANLKDLKLELPPGLVGDPNATPKCNYQTFVTLHNQVSECPSETAVGISTAYTGEDGGAEVYATSDAVYNLVPPKGVAAEFGFIVAGEVPVLVDTGVRTGSDYGLTTTATEVSQGALLIADKVTIWGVPTSPTHNLYRGGCIRSGGHLLEEGLESVDQGLGKSEDEFEGPDGEFGSGYIVEPSRESLEKGGCPARAQGPLLTNPTSCGASRTVALSVDDWEEPGDFVGDTASLPELTGCERLQFSAKLGVSPEKTAASTPTGVGLEVQVPQEGTESATQLAEADLKGASVALPSGLQLNPSAAGGLEVCSPSQIGFTGFKELNPTTEAGVQTPQFTPNAPSCPKGAKVAKLKIKSPLLEGELEGAVYLAAPQNYEAGPLENPFRSLTAFYGVAEEPKTGVLVKIPGNIERNVVTGQLTGKIENSPQLPFTTAKFEFFGGERAPLATPAHCGAYTSEASFTPWSTSTPFQTSSTFEVTSGPGGSPCPGGALPFTPTLQAGATDLNAGAFTALQTVLGREDGEQALQNATISFPTGVSAVLTGVPLCPEAQANAGTCGAETRIGEATASVGVGSQPYTVTGGKVYLTGPYDGAPYGLSIAVPPVAGPFVLDEGAPVITRAKIEIDPITAAVTVTTTGEIPHILDGVPLDIKHIDVTVNRPGFAINPTSCDPMAVTGTITGLEGTPSPVSDPFQLANCGNLKFGPQVAITTGAHSSKKDGASLDFKISYPGGSLGSESWVKEAKFVIPKQLPAELKTIQQACLAATFEANPANCPTHSKIGEAVVHTQLLPEPLKGPVYFVSYGAAKFPDAVILLSGDNVHIRLTGETYIHNGITSATFPSTPDVPFESVEVDLPTGEYSEFGTNLGLGKYDFCGQQLKVPTEFKAQNGAEIHEETPVSVTGCPSTISVQSATTRKRALSVTVYVPAAGKLAVSGKGLPNKSKAATGQQLLTFSLTPKKAGRLRTKIKLTYTPAKGKKQTKTVKASFKG
jgi:hypothetical protein